MRRARRRALPCIRKDFLVDPWQVAESRALGADAILVILAMVDDSLAADLMAEAEPIRHGRAGRDPRRGRDGARRSPGRDLVGVNNRDLRTFDADLATERLAGGSPQTLCWSPKAASSPPPTSRASHAAGATAMLVGESLMRQADVEAATRALLSCARPAPRGLT